MLPFLGSYSNLRTSLLSKGENRLSRSPPPCPCSSRTCREGRTRDRCRRDRRSVSHHDLSRLPDWWTASPRAAEHPRALLSRHRLPSQSLQVQKFLGLAREPHGWGRWP